jgi:cyclase
VDELIYIDAVASLYGRNSLEELVSRTARDVFIPMTVGGGVRSVGDVERLLRAGADKVAVNTGAVARPELVGEVARRFGSQCMVLSVQAKRQGPGRWEAYTEGGRERTGLDAVEHARRAAGEGAGEILLTSIDQDGTRRGFDLELIRAVSGAVGVPVIASSGLGAPEHLVAAVREGRADAVAVGAALHYGAVDLKALRAAAAAAGIALRPQPEDYQPPAAGDAERGTAPATAAPTKPSVQGAP